MSEFIQFISKQLISKEHSVEILNDHIQIRYNDQNYSEPLFDITAVFSESELLKLISISTTILNEEEINIEELPILKCWYLITHEKYFQDTIVFDKYDRIGQENLRKEFLEILKVPIADVLKIHLNNLLGVNLSKRPSIYLTCDFDILNIWDVWTPKDLAREILHTSKKFQFKKLYETVGSFLLSRKKLNFNGFLNERMYCYDSGFTNIGFFIASPTNKKYDGKIDYSNKLVKTYIHKLKKNGVLFGLHTNFDTKDQPESILKQQTDFKHLFGETTTLNRHHYLRFHFPDFLKTLELGKIEKDFSLYFPESMLFRAGTSSAYYAWTENENRAYKTQLIPTTIMDGTFSDYLHCDFPVALELSIKKIDLALKFSNSVVLLWHNRSTYPYANIENNYHPKLISELIGYLKRTVNS